MRYLLYIVLSLPGFALMTAGWTSLGIGAIYGGVFLACLPFAIGEAERARADTIREREERAANARRDAATH